MQNRNSFFSVPGAKTGFLYGAGIMADLILYFCAYDLLTGSRYGDFRTPDNLLLLLGWGAVTGVSLGAAGICFQPRVADVINEEDNEVYRPKLD